MSNLQKQSELLDEQIKSFSLKMLGLFGGDLLALVSQKPSWPVFDSESIQWINLLLIVTEPQLPYCQNIFNQYFTKENPEFPFPVEIVGYQSFSEKLNIGDPTVVYICASGKIHYDTSGTFKKLKEIANNQSHRVDANRLRKFLESKCIGHFNNIGFLLARLLNEIYMGTISGLTRNILEGESEVELGILLKSAQWNKIKYLSANKGIFKDEIPLVEDILSDISLLLKSRDSQKELPKYGQDIIKIAQNLFRSLSS